MAAEAAHQAVRNTPSPRLLLMWAIASTYTGRYGDARAAYSAVLERTPSEPTAWVGLAGIALRLGDRTLADSAFTRLQTYAPDSPEARQVRTLVRFHPVVLPLARE
jgi:Flp pilus assembly protein TadD